jgi:hypothetical protein
MGVPFTLESTRELVVNSGSSNDPGRKPTMMQVARNKVASRSDLCRGVSGIRCRKGALAESKARLTEGLCAGIFLSMLLMTAFHSAEYSTGRGGVVPLVIFWMSPCIVARVEIPVSRVQAFSRVQPDIVFEFYAEERQRSRVNKEAKIDVERKTEEITQSVVINMRDSLAVRRRSAKGSG